MAPSRNSLDLGPNHVGRFPKRSSPEPVMCPAPGAARTLDLDLVLRGDDKNHVTRNASIGSTLIARRAGK
jgi:hypothetical protein